MWNMHNRDRDREETPYLTSFHNNSIKLKTSFPCSKDAQMFISDREINKQRRVERERERGRRKGKV
jgi:hypothetical protein